MSDQERHTYRRTNRPAQGGDEYAQGAVARAEAIAAGYDVAAGGGVDPANLDFAFAFDQLAAEARGLVDADGEGAACRTLVARFAGLVQDDRERAGVVVGMMVEGVLREARRTPGEEAV